MPKKLEIIGLTFGRLTVTREAERSARGVVRWLCRCECGKEAIVFSQKLTGGNTRSCGCLRQDSNASRSTHDKRHDVEYRTWMSMKARCLNHLCADYPRYGGRGITICDRWLDSFEHFLADMGKRPTQKHQIDRINNDNGYEASNCRWATPKENSQNKRNSKWWIINGIKYETCQQAAEACGATRLTIFNRLKRGVHGYQVEPRYSA